MSLAIEDTSSSALFVHSNRQQWGVSVVAWEAGGKRGYLFEDGVERTMASGFHEMMQRVEWPSPEQQAILERLQKMLAGRSGASFTAGSTGPSFTDQLARLRAVYAEGFLDAKWVKAVRGDGAELRAAAHRTASQREAQEQLSAAELDALIGNQRFGEVWDRVIGVLSRTDLVPAAQMKQPKAARGEQWRDVALAVRELLYGKATYEQRFDRYVTAFGAAAGEPARWEIATALSALVHPGEHVCVQLAAFLLQLKAKGSRGTIPARPAGTEYTRLQSLAREISKKLTEHGEAPRDLLDVYDFIRLSLKPVAKARVTTPKSPARSRSARPAADDGLESAAEEG